MTFVGIALTALTFIVGIVTLLIPYIFTHELRREYTRAIADAQEAAKSAKEFAASAKQDSVEIARRRKRLESIPPDKQVTPEERTDINNVATDPDAPTRDRLHARALKAQDSGEWELAAVFWRTLTELYPTEGEFHFGLGYALQQAAEKKDGDEKFHLLDQAIESYKRAYEIIPKSHGSLNNWGIALSGQAKTKSGTEADRLFDLACQKYRAALKIKPDSHGTFNNWGNTLSAQAQTKSGTEADRLFDLACQKYQAAIKIKPDMYQAYHNWGGALSDQARQKEGEEAKRLIAEAKDKIDAAERIRASMSAS